MTQRNKYSLIELQLLHICSQTLLLREWRRLITKRDWPVLIKLWTGKMNIEIKFHISFQITVNISGKKPIISVDSPSTKGSVSIV